MLVLTHFGSISRLASIVSNVMSPEIVLVRPQSKLQLDCNVYYCICEGPPTFRHHHQLSRNGTKVFCNQLEKPTVGQIIFDDLVVGIIIYSFVCFTASEYLFRFIMIMLIKITFIQLSLCLTTIYLVLLQSDHFEQFRN